MADVFSDIFSSNVLKKLVAEELNVKTNAFSVNAHIIPETNLLIVQVTGEDPQIVHRAIGEVLEHCTEVSEYVFSNAVLDILQSPTVVASSSSFSASTSWISGTSCCLNLYMLLPLYPMEPSPFGG
jgi:hypothetical protein